MNKHIDGILCAKPEKASPDMIKTRPKGLITLNLEMLETVIGTLSAEIAELATVVAPAVAPTNPDKGPTDDSKGLEKPAGSSIAERIFRASDCILSLCENVRDLRNRIEL